MERLRKVTIEPTNTGVYTLETWETEKRHPRGTDMIGYRLTAPDGNVLFEGEDFSCSPMDAIDSDESLRALLGFLTLKPGDTDQEYFDKYTEAQMAWCQSFDCDAMGLWAMEPEEDFETPEFVDVD